MRLRRIPIAGLVALWCLIGLLPPQSGEAGQETSAQTSARPAAVASPPPLAINGPPAPVPPAVVSRDSAGHVTIRAVRLDAPIRIDGALDDAVYQTVLPISDFVQVEPANGAPATEKTETWLTFDRDYVYVSFRCWESAPERRVAKSMRRDVGVNWSGDDHVTIFFDTFYDRRNGFSITITSLGGRNDGSVTNERQYGGDWNPIYDFAVGQFEGGWTAELALPFKSLRYRQGQAQVWGFNALRTNRWKNELSLVAPVPSGRAMNSVQQASLAATVVGIEAPLRSRNLDVKPYVVSSVASDRTASPQVINDPSADIGIDVKYGVTDGLTADVTVNTDFAQVEADEQQINLTRFSLFFPEKREFFLENQGTFSFGGVSAVGQAAAGSDAPILFYSRRIGLENGRAIPLRLGGRLTGRVGRYSLGLLNIQTGDERVAGVRATNFSAVRVKRDILRRSSVGLLFTGRSADASGGGANAVFGVDGTFAFFNDLTINTYWAKTETDGLTSNDTSYRAHFDYNGDRYGLQLERLAVGDDFNPGIGFVRRPDMRRTFGQARFSPRPRSIPSVRRFSWIGALAYVENGEGRLETREGTAEFAIEFQNADRLSINYSGNYEYLPKPFTISRGVVLPVGAYRFDAVEAAFNLGQQRRISANLSAEYGSFYSGHRTAVNARGGRVNFGTHFSLEPSYSVNWVDLPEGTFTTHLAGSRITYTMTPLMFTSALVQYASASRAVMANVRLRWEYQPGSELFVVYNEQRDTTGRAFPALASRSLIVKVNRLFRF